MNFSQVFQVYFLKGGLFPGFSIHPINETIFIGLKIGLPASSWKSIFYYKYAVCINRVSTKELA